MPDDAQQPPGNLPGVMIPMIRRTFPEILATDLVRVQPMDGPVGLAFALRYSYGDDPLWEVKMRVQKDKRIALQMQN